MPDPNPISQSAGRRFLTSWTIIWIVAWAGLFVLTHTPRLPGVPLPKHSDKAIHFCAYFTLGLIGARSALSRRVQLTSGWFLKWLIIYLIYGAVDELLQGPVHRNPSAWDWLADVAGAAAALGTAYVNRPTEPEADAS